MPVEYRQNKNYTSTHLSYYELPHSLGRHHMSQNYNQQNASDRLYQIAIQAAVAKAESSKSTNDEIPHLTPQQWQLLNDYHEHDLFVRTRSWSFCMAVLGVGVTLFGIGSPAWKWIGDSRNPYELGLWTLCLPNNSTCLSIIYHLQNNWTGECFLVSSIATITALILYPISAETCIQNLLNLNIFKIKSTDHTSTISISSNNNNKNPASEEDVSLTNIETQFGYTYFLTWIAALFFVNSFICMNLDLLIQSFVRPIPLISNTINNLMPCCGLSTSLSESPVSSKSSHSSCHFNESIYKKQRHECTEQNIEHMVISNSNQNTETNPSGNLHSKRKLIKYQREFVSFDDSITENSQHQPCQVPNILLSDYDKECELINSRNKELCKENSINITDEIVVIPDEILQDSGQDGEWI
uniref:Transmembrane protein n=1 Tax=Schistosoma haematobium TaxID=6185 RepID=A0A095AGL2_SCHHA